MYALGKASKKKYDKCHTGIWPPPLRVMDLRPQTPPFFSPPNKCVLIDSKWHKTHFGALFFKPSIRFHLTTQLCLMFVLQVFSHEASQPKDDDYGLEACKFLDNLAFNDQGKNPFSRWGSHHGRGPPWYDNSRVISALLQRVLHTAQAVW